MAPLTGKYLETFNRRIIRTPGCWEWDGAHTTAGYAETWDGVRPQYAHRASYELHKGPIPDGLQVDHLCRNRGCVNPDHLEAVSNRENSLRGSGPTAANHRRTLCKNGHPLSGDNLYVTTAGYRRCRICIRARNPGPIPGAQIKRPDLDDQEIVRLIDGGWSVSAVARQLGAARKTIKYRYAKATGGPWEPR
jgi:hypothetical protein